MTINKRSKQSRHRGSWTHSWGAKKKHRGAGSRGGRGRAGTGKRGDAKKPSIWQNKNYFGKKGFESKTGSTVRATNIAFIENHFEKLLLQKKIKEEAGLFAINLKEMGYDKLLGRGKATRKYKVDVPVATKKAVDTITKAGGQLVQKEE